MTQRKLTRATAPMCPECEHTLAGEGPSYQCMNCGHCCGRTYETNPDWGYLAPDVSDAAALMRSVAKVIADIPGARDQATRLLSMAKVLEGDHE